MTDPVLIKNGAKTDYWKTGHSYIKRRVADLKALAGFEKSGHFFFNNPIGRGYDDGLLTAGEVAQLKLDADLVDEMMEHVASMYEEDTRAAISALSQSIEPILIVMMSLIVGVLVLGIFVPMWDMGQAARAR